MLFKKNSIKKSISHPSVTSSTRSCCLRAAGPSQLQAWAVCRSPSTVPVPVRRGQSGGRAGVPHSRFPVPRSRRDGAHRVPVPVPAPPGRAQRVRANSAPSWSRPATQRELPALAPPQWAGLHRRLARSHWASPGKGRYRLSRDEGRALSCPMAPSGGGRPRALATPVWKGAAAAAGQILARPRPRAGRARASRGCGSCRWSSARGGPCAGAAGDAGVGPRRFRGAGGYCPAGREAALRPRAGEGRRLGRD